MVQPKVEIDMQKSPPVQPADVELTDKAKSFVDPEDLKSRAQFWSNASDFKLGLEEQKQQTVNGRTIDLPGTGESVQFRNHTAIVVGEKKIQKCLRTKAFQRGLFAIDEMDPTGYWEKKGFVQKVTQTNTIPQLTGKKVEPDPVEA